MKQKLDREKWDSPLEIETKSQSWKQSINYKAEEISTK